MPMMKDMLPLHIASAEPGATQRPPEKTPVTQVLLTQADCPTWPHAWHTKEGPPGGELQKRFVLQSWFNPQQGPPSNPHWRQVPLWHETELPLHELPGQPQHC
jgi:hypothetical protein